MPNSSPDRAHERASRAELSTGHTASAEPRTVHTSRAELSTQRDTLALTLLAGVGPTEFARRVGQHGSPAAALDAVHVADRQRVLDAADALLERAAAAGARCLLPSDSGYPPALADLPVVPPLLWARGTPALAAQRSVAIVGTRMASPTGLRTARALAEACAGAGLCVVSGLARGIDGAAHEGALAANGHTVAVLGTGVDVPYPPKHRALQERIAHDGLLLSEVPPGERGHSGTFPQRNRLIAALGEITVVVEAGEQSGALITARHAEQMGRRIAAVPGPIDAPQAAGSNHLLRDHVANMLCGVNDLLSLLDIDSGPVAAPLLEGDAAACWHALALGAADTETLAARANLDVRRTTVALSALEVEGLVELDAGGTVRPLVTCIT